MTPEEKLKVLGKAFGMIAPSGYWFREVMEKIWEAKTEEEAIKIAKEARQFIDIKLEGVGPVENVSTYPMDFKCSNCGKWAKVIDMNFCPGCGEPVKK